MALTVDTGMATVTTEFSRRNSGPCQNDQNAEAISEASVRNESGRHESYETRSGSRQRPSTASEGTVGMWKGRVVMLGRRRRVVSRQKLLPGVREYPKAGVRYRIR